MTVTSTQVETLLTDILGETASSTADSTDLSQYLALSNLGAANTVTTLASQIALAPEAGIVQEIYRLYEAVLGRAPDAGGLQSWVATAEAGLTVAQIQIGAGSVSQATWNSIINGFTASTEFQSKYSGIGGSALVDLLYQNILGRAPDPTGLTTWTDILGSAVAGAGPTPAAVIQVVNGIVNSTEFINDSLANNTASTVAAAVADTGTGPTYSVTPVTAVETTVALTTGADTVTGSGNLVITGAATTVTALDSIALTGTSNVLNLTDATTGGKGIDITLFSSVSGVQTLNFTELNEFKGDALNVSGWTGLTTANIIGYSINSGNTATITAAATTAVNLTETLTAATGTTVVGGSTVTINEANAVNNSGKTITVTGGTGTTAVSVTQTNSTGGVGDAAVTITDIHGMLGGDGKDSILTTVTIDGDDGAALEVDSNNVTSLTVNDVSNSALQILQEGGDATTGTTLALSLNNDSSLGLGGVFFLSYTALNITTGASASSIGTSNFHNVTALTVAGASTLTINAAGLSTLATVAVSGAAGLSANLSALADLTAVTSTSTGTITLTLNDTQETFTGGAGQDIITITGAATKAITGGSATNNELVWNTAAATTFGTVSRFTMLGVSGGTSGTFDLSKLTNFNSLDVISVGVGGVTFTNVVAGTPLAIDNGTIDTVTYQTADTAGATDSVAVTFGGTATNTAAVFTALTFEDSVFDGIGTLNVVSYDKTANAQNGSSTFSDASLAVLNVSGNAGLSLGTFTDNAKSLTIAGSETGTGGILLAGVTAATATALTSLTVTGSDAVTITGWTDTGTSFTVSDSASATVTIATLTDSSATTETFTNTGSKALTIGSTAHSGAAVATLSLSANVTYTATADAVSSGIIVTGGSDNNVVTFTATNGAAATKTDSITLGNGANVISDLSSAGTVNITVGTGANQITTGTGTFNITVGTHTAATASDTFTVGANASTSVLTTITGAVAGDTIIIGDATNQALVQVTAAEVAADTTHAGNMTLLSNWIAAALDTTANGGANLAQHQIGWFNFQGYTYFVEQSANLGTETLTGDTIVKLLGSFNEASIGNATAGGHFTLV